jgi:hypothetical protein
MLQQSAARIDDILQQPVMPEQCTAALNVLKLLVFFKVLLRKWSAVGMG